MILLFRSGVSKRRNGRTPDPARYSSRASRCSGGPIPRLADSRGPHCLHCSSGVGEGVSVQATAPNLSFLICHLRRDHDYLHRACPLRSCFVRLRDHDSGATPSHDWAVGESASNRRVHEPLEERVVFARTPFVCSMFPILSFFACFKCV